MSTAPSLPARSLKLRMGSRNRNKIIKQWDTTVTAIGDAAVSEQGTVEIG